MLKKVDKLKAAVAWPLGLDRREVIGKVGGEKIQMEKKSKEILLKKSINRGYGSQTCHSIPDIQHDWTGGPKYPASEGENNRRRTVPVCGLL